MKLIGKLAKPTKTAIDDTSISLTIDRNKKLHSEVLLLTILKCACHCVLYAVSVDIEHVTNCYLQSKAPDLES